MDATWRTSVWRQYGAAIDMLKDSIELCPDDRWSTVVWDDAEDRRYGHFWFLAFHTLCWLDIFLTGSEEGFMPPPPFVRGILPEQPYTKQQILAYLGICRSKCQSIIESLTEEQAQRRCIFGGMHLSYLELQLYSMRHVQEHAAQLSLVLGQHGVTGMDWVASARNAA